MFRTSSVCHHERFVQAVLPTTLYRLDVSSSTHSSTTYQSLPIQLVQNAPDDGQMRSETCRANLSAEKNLLIKNTLCILLDYIYKKI